MRFAISAFIVFSAAVSAQPAPKEFEVASIRPVELKNVMAGYSVAGPTVTFDVFNIQMLITEAYGLEQHELVVSQDVSRSLPGYYTIVAKAPGSESPTRADTRSMLQELLASRFKLRFHREPRETAVYTLQLGKAGSKLRESKPDLPAESYHRVRGRNQTIEVTHMTMPQLARELRSFVDRPVIDRTGLTGKYDVNVEATPMFRLSNPQPEDITMFTAIQDALGLRLEPERVPLSVLVVDSVAAPSEN